MAPYSGETWDLVKGEMISQAPIVPVIRKQAQGGVQISTERTGKNRSVYEELRNAGVGLIDLIEQEQGASNKEIKRLTREINELIAKYRA